MITITKNEIIQALLILSLLYLLVMKKVLPALKNRQDTNNVRINAMGSWVALSPMAYYAYVELPLNLH